jgi:mono/diheme cytochrome c family protein
VQRRSFATTALILAPVFAASVATLAGKDSTPAPAAANADAIARGRYLVTFGSCHDCHTPFKIGPKGPGPDMSRALSGHPSDLGVPPAPPKLEGPWMAAFTGTNTAWAGPWGISFTANLTPDKETGLGNWTEEQFILALRTGRHEGRGRPIKPPMPWPFVGSLNDDDLKAVFAYLQSLPPIRNKVPAPIDPPEESGR